MTTATTGFRARLIEYDGATAVFDAAFQRGIRLAATGLDDLVGREADIRARVTYTADFAIAGGELIEFVAVDESRDPIAELQEWYRTAIGGAPEDRLQSEDA